jgi:acetylornithine deacetylase
MSTYEWLQKLIAFDTTSRHSNLPLITCLQAALPIPSQLIYDHTGKKANLFATFPATDRSLDGGLILSGHTDVVPVDGQAWDSNPFELMQSNDRLYGRGTSDMKGFIAVIMALLPEWKTLTLKKPLHLAFTYDEEVGCLGAPSLIEHFLKQGIHPAACVVGEPTEMRVVIANKGIQLFRCRFYGRATHSSLTPQGCNAIEYAAKFITRIREIANELQSAAQDSHFDVPFTSMTTNVIQGGTAGNIIPSFCEFLFEFRNLPSIDPAIIIAKIQNERIILQKAMQRDFPDAKIEMEQLGAVPAFEADEKAPFSELIRYLTKEKESHKVSYATEAGLFQRAGIPTIICGPGSIEEAHRPNEYVTLSQITQCENFLRELVLTTCVAS